MSGKIFVPIVTGFDKKGIDQAASALGQLGSKIKSTAAGIISAATISDLVRDSIVGARDLQRNFVALDTIFGQYSQRMKNFAKDSANFGVSTVESAKASVFLGSVLKQSGFTMDQVSGETQKLVKLAADLATTYGYDVSEALTGMTALFRGEYDPIEKFGVAMKQAEVNALLLERGQNKLTGEQLRHAQAVARLELLYQRASDAMGAFENQGDSLFASQKKLTAGLQNLSSALGSMLTVSLTEAIKSADSAVGILTPAFTETYQIIERVVNALTPAIPILAKMGKFIMDVINPAADSLVSLFSAIAPIIEAIWIVLQPVFDGIAGVLDILQLLIKYLSIAIKLFAIVALQRAKLVEQFTFGLVKGTDASLGTFFRGLTADADTFNAQLDEIIANMTKVGGLASSNIATDPNSIAPYLPGMGNPDTTDAIGQWLMTGLTNSLKSAETWTEDMKKLFATFKSDIRSTLINLIPAGFIDRDLGRFESAVADTYKNITIKVAKAVEDGLLSKKASKDLLNYAKKELDVLGRLARKRDELAKKYSLTKTLMADIKKTTIGFANLADLMGKVSEDVVTTVTTVVDKFTISVTKSSKSMVDAKSLIDQYRDVVGRTRTFVKDLQALQSLNLNKSLFDQIVNAGLDSGSAIASALVSGGATVVNELNSLYVELSDLGGTLGETTAQVMYGAGIDASNGLLKGLLSMDEKFKKAAEDLAKSFADAFNKGISSRSGSGLKVDTSAAESLLSSASFRGAGLRSSSNINVTVNAGIGTDGASVGREIVTAIKKYERASGRVFATAV